MMAKSAESSHFRIVGHHTSLFSSCSWYCLRIAACLLNKVLNERIENRVRSLPIRRISVAVCTANKSIYLIQPKFPPSYWGLEYFLRLTHYHAAFPPLGLLTLAALTPRDFKVTLCDENAGEHVDYQTDAQIVGITGYIMQDHRVFAMADRFRALGKTVVLGGPLANLMPAECRPHCDILFEGEAEYTWPCFLNEYSMGAYSDHYHEPEKIHLPDSPPPRL